MTADLARNQWVKRIRGKVRNFGTLDKPKAALAKYQREGPALHAGIEPTAAPTDSLTVGELCGRWIESRTADVALKMLARKSLNDYEDTATRVMAILGKATPVAALGPANFEKLRQRVAASFGAARLGKFVVITRMLFSWGHDQEICNLPHWGKKFRGVDSKTRRDMKNRAARNLLTQDQLRRVLLAANPTMQAMVLLALNGGLGNTDVAELRLGHLVPKGAKNPELPSGWLQYPRHKTAVQREVPLWPETEAALLRVLADRVPHADDPEDLIFINSEGGSWVSASNDNIAREFPKLLIKLGILKRTPITKTPGKGGHTPTSAKPAVPIGFYTLRRTFRTVADEAGDQHAVHRVMGHQLPGMSGIYVQNIDLKRLTAVCQHVRDWLYLGWTLPLNDKPKLQELNQRKPVAVAAPAVP